MNDRIKAVRAALNLSQDEFGKRLGVTRGAITNIELHKVEPKPMMISLICTTFNVNEEWLRTGEGEMFIPLTRNQVIADYVGKVMKDETAEFQKFIIELMSSLPVECWETIEEKAREIRGK